MVKAVHPLAGQTGSRRRQAAVFAFIKQLDDNNTLDFDGEVGMIALLKGGKILGFKEHHVRHHDARVFTTSLLKAILEV